MISGDIPAQPGTHGVQVDWPSVEGRTYTVKWSATPGGVYQVLESGINATPPMNSYAIESVLPRGFFKVFVE
jgi:hypothetical protein